MYLVDHLTGEQFGAVEIAPRTNGHFSLALQLNGLTAEEAERLYCRLHTLLTTEFNADTRRLGTTFLT